MGLIRTKFDNAKFDVDKFDYSYDTDDTFPSESQDDVDTILTEVGTTYTIKRQTTTQNGMGEVETVTNDEYSALGYLQDISIKLEVPEGVNLVQGTEKKIISSLGEGETFQYEVVFRFDLEQTHFDGRVIRVNANLGDGQRLAKSSIKLGGKPVEVKKE